MVEDLQTSYWERVIETDRGGSKDLNASFTRMNFLKGLIDGLNHREFTIPNYGPSYLERSVVAMHYYHNLAFIQKGLNDEASNIIKKT